MRGPARQAGPTQGGLVLRHSPSYTIGYSQPPATPRNPPMKCDEGYICEVCGQYVEGITESDLYLRYILGEVPLERLHLQRERHVRCNPALAQFIVDPEFPALSCDGPF